MEIQTIVLGPFETNCYVLREAGECWVVDPGLAPGPLIQYLKANRLSPRRILVTHGHADHIAGVGAVLAEAPLARLCCPEADAPMLTDAELNLSAQFGVPLMTAPPQELLQAGQEMAMGSLVWRVLDTSGHTPGGVSFYCERESVVITGDALFERSIGRTDLPGSDTDRLLANIRRHLLCLPADTRVLPGHGPATTIGGEKLENPFL